MCRLADDLEADRLALGDVGSHFGEPQPVETGRVVETRPFPPVAWARITAGIVRVIDVVVRCVRPVERGAVGGVCRVWPLLPVLGQDDVQHTVVTAVTDRIVGQADVGLYGCRPSAGALRSRGFWPLLLGVATICRSSLCAVLARLLIVLGRRGDRFGRGRRRRRSCVGLVGGLLRRWT